MAEIQGPLEMLLPSQGRRSPELGAVLVSVLRRPLATVVEAFNWKAAATSAILRAILFFCTNVRAGQQLALRATLVEVTYSICAMGVFGAVTERIRNARPAWMTGLIVWLAIPTVLLSAQYFVHRSFGTPQLRASMIGSFCYAALGTGFNWFAMRRGVMIVGAERRSFADDLRALPNLILSFVTALPRAILAR